MNLPFIYNRVARRLRSIISPVLGQIFCPDYYLEKNHVTKLTRFPFIHYLLVGRWKDYEINFFLDPHWYAETYSIKSNTVKAVARHYCKHSLQNSPHPFFDSPWYAHTNNDIAKGVNPLGHYTHFGRSEGRPPNPLFHTGYYQQQLHKEEKVSVDIEDLPLHYLQKGFKTKSPCRLFDVEFIFENYPEFSDTGLSLVQYLSDKSLWNLKTHLLFDGEYYCKQFTDSGSQLNTAPLMHYARDNKKSEYNPHILFHDLWYRNRNKQIDEFKSRVASPLMHYLEIGSQKGESPHPLFNAAWYYNFYLDGDRKSIDALSHYILSGDVMGYKPSPLFDAEKFKVNNNIDERHNALVYYLKNNKPIELPEQRNRLLDAFVAKEVPATKPVLKEADYFSGKNYIILFTPRSGSSFLTDIISSTEKLGQPGEWFNQDLIHGARRYIPWQTNTLMDYARGVQKTYSNEANIFGIELGSLHLENAEQQHKLQELFPNSKFIFHYREDIVSLAVSLFLATETGFFHSTQKGTEQKPPYNHRKIKKWVMRTAKQEVKMLEYMQQNNIKPLISTYETLIADPRSTVQSIADFLGEPRPDLVLEEKARKKIGSRYNKWLIIKFCKKEDELLKEIYAERERLLKQLN